MTSARVRGFAATITANQQPGGRSGERPAYPQHDQENEERDRIKQQQEAKADAERKYQSAIAEQLQYERDHGYKRMTFDDFELDGKELAAKEAKVAIQGFFIKRGEIEMLMPSQFALAVAQQTGNDVGIGILTDGAQRSLRKYFLDCVKNPASAQLGCPITILGHASTCTKTNLVGSKNVPCVIVEDGWHIAR